MAVVDTKLPYVSHTTVERISKKTIRLHAIPQREGMTIKISDPKRLESYACYLLVHNLEGKKRNAYIGWSWDPVAATRELNLGKLDDKEARSAAPHWRLDSIVGPFPTPSACLDACTEWTTGSRGVESKRTRAVEVAKRYGVKCYSTANRLSPESELEYLRKTLSPSLLPIAERLLKSMISSKR